MHQGRRRDTDFRTKVGEIWFSRSQRGSYLVVLVDANAPTGRRVDGPSNDVGRVLGSYGRDMKKKNNGEQLLSFPTNCKFALNNTFFSPRPRQGCNIAYSHRCRPNDRKRVDYVLSRQAHRPRVHDVKVHPQPSSRDKPDSDHDIVYVTVDLGGLCAPNGQFLKALKCLPLDRQFFFPRRGVP